MTATMPGVPATLAQPLARGQNVLHLAPPAPVHALPLLAALRERYQGDGTLLVLAPAPSLGEWHAVAAAAGIPMLVARGTSQDRNRVRQFTGGVLVTTPEGAMDLLGASAFDAAAVSGVLVAWPECWNDREVLAGLLQDVPRDAQRVILTSAPETLPDLIERHAWRAATAGPPAAAAPIGPVRTLAVAWERRAAVLPDLVGLLEVRTAAVWTADSTRHAEIHQALAGTGVATEVTTEVPGPVDAVIAFDPPSPQVLGDLLHAGDLTLLMPPGTEAWVARVAAPRRPLILPGDPASTGGEAAQRRRTIARTVEESTLEPGLLALGPLFERFEPTAVAAALYELWRGETPRGPAAVPVTAAAVTRVWVNAGRKDEVGAGDLVGLLVNEIGLDRGRIGRIEVRETFSLVELSDEDAGRVAGALTGKTLRRRRLIARPDEPGAPRRVGRRPPPRQAP